MAAVIKDIIFNLYKIDISIDSAIKETGVLHISCVCRGKRKTDGRYILKYKEQ